MKFSNNDKIAILYTIYQLLKEEIVYKRDQRFYEMLWLGSPMNQDWSKRHHLQILIQITEINLYKVSILLSDRQYKISSIILSEQCSPLFSNIYSAAKRQWCVLFTGNNNLCYKRYVMEKMKPNFKRLLGQYAVATIKKHKQSLS